MAETRLMRRAQLKMGETIIVLIIFFFLLVFGLVFYAGINKSSANDDLKKRFALEAVQTSQKVESLPEIQCTVSGSTDYDCIDIYKLEAFAEIAKSNAAIYDKIFPNTRIAAISSFPGPPHRWDLYDGVTRTDQSLHNFTLPVALYDPVLEKHSFGMLLIEVYQ